MTKIEPRQKIYAKKVLFSYLSASKVKRLRTIKLRLQRNSELATIATDIRAKAGISKQDHIMAFRCLSDSDLESLATEYHNLVNRVST